MKRLFALVFGMLAVNAFGQSQQDIEKDLLRQFKKIDYWSMYDDKDNKVDKFDSLEVANERFEKSLVQYTSRNAATISYGFKELEKEGLMITTAPNGLFRIYTWDTRTGGTMRIFSNVYQYKAGNKVGSKTIATEEGDAGSWYSNIYQLQKGNQTYYLAVYHGIYSTRDRYDGIKVFSIDNGSLNDSVKLIKTKSGLHNTLGYSYDFFEAKENATMLSYDANKKTIILPVVLEGGKVTDKKIIYQFTGSYFERK